MRHFDDDDDDVIVVVLMRLFQTFFRDELLRKRYEDEQVFLFNTVCLEL